MLGGLCQIEIQVKELERSLKFYREVFGWHPVPATMHNITILQVPASYPFGISLIHNPSLKSTRSQSTLYFACQEPEKILGKVEAYGGKVLLAQKKLPGYGNISIFSDPEGQKLGIFTATAAPAGTAG